MNEVKTKQQKGKYCLLHIYLNYIKELKLIKFNIAYAD